MRDTDTAPARPAEPGIDSRTLMHWAVVFAVILALLVAARPFLIPLAVAVLLWILVNGLADLVQRPGLAGWRAPRPLALGLAVGTIGCGLFVVYLILSRQTFALVEAAPRYQERLGALVEAGFEAIGLDVATELEQLQSRLDVPGLLAGLAGGLGAMMLDLVLVLIYLAFLLVEQGHFAEKLARLRPAGMDSEEVARLVGRMARQIQTYLWVKTLVSLLTGVASWALLALVGVDFAAFWGLVAFLLNFIPNIGSAVAMVFPAALALVQFDTLWPFLVVVLGLGALQFTIGNVLEPAVAGRTLNLSALAIILALTFWGMIWGVAGMVLCVPITVALVIVCASVPSLEWIAVLLSRDGRIDADQEQAT